MSSDEKPHFKSHYRRYLYAICARVALPDCAGHGRVRVPGFEVASTFSSRDSECCFPGHPTRSKKPPQWLQPEQQTPCHLVRAQHVYYVLVHCQDVAKAAVTRAILINRCPGHRLTNKLHYIDANTHDVGMGRREMCDLHGCRFIAIYQARPKIANDLELVGTSRRQHGFGAPHRFLKEYVVTHLLGQLHVLAQCVTSRRHLLGTVDQRVDGVACNAQGRRRCFGGNHERKCIQWAGAFDLCSVREAERVLRFDKHASTRMSLLQVPRSPVAHHVSRISQ
jgi:hypothetical protein